MGTLDIDLAIKLAVNDRGKFKEGPKSVREELLKYKENPDVRDAFEAIGRLFGSVTSTGAKDVSDILVVRYGLQRNLANREVTSPIKVFQAIGRR